MHEHTSFALQTSELLSAEGFRDMMLLAASPRVLEGGKISERMLQKLGAIEVLLTNRGVEAPLMSSGNKATIKNLSAGLRFTEHTPQVNEKSSITKFVQDRELVR